MHQEDFYKYGDVYALTSLPEFKQKLVGTGTHRLKNIDSNCALDVVGDSYTQPGRWRGDCLNGASYTHTHISHGVLPIPADGSKLNILIVEVIERNFLKSCRADFTRFGNTNSEPLSVVNKVANTLAYFDGYFNKSIINSRLEYFAGHNRRSRSVKEIKAQLQWYLLGESYGGLRRSIKYDYLYLAETVDSLATGSCYKQVSLADKLLINTAVHQLGKSAAALGYDKVILSVIPEKARIYPAYPEMQNDLFGYLTTLGSAGVALLEVNASIDSAAKKEEMYWKSDTHWKPAATNIWLKKLDQLLFGVTKKSGN
jgi:hypothetical protein